MKAYGKGSKTVILIGGGPSLSNYMSTLGTTLASTSRIVEYSQKGTPENPATRKDELSLNSHLADLKEIVVLQRGKPVVLLGHSWGASLALLFIANHPGMIERTILIGSAPLSDPINEKFGENIQSRLSESATAKLKLIKSSVEKAKTDSEINALMQQRLRIIGPAYHLDPTTEEHFSQLRWNYTSFITSIDSLWDFIDAGHVPKALARISDPVVAFHGDHDPIPLQETFTFLDAHLGDLKTVEVKKSGHFPWLEKTSNVEFLKKLVDEVAGNPIDHTKSSP